VALSATDPSERRGSLGASARRVAPALSSLLRFFRQLISVPVLGGLALVAAAVATFLLVGGGKPAPEGRGGDHAAQGPERSTGSTTSLSLVWVGDMSISASQGLPSNPDEIMNARVKRRLAASDVTVGNLEGTLGSGGGSKCGAGSANCFAFQAPPGYARLYKRSGFDLMNVANNHAFDYGASGQRQTIAALDRAGVDHVGRPGQIVIRSVRGVKVAFVGFAPYPWASQLRDIEAAKRLVRRAQRRADVVVVLMHAGAEGADQTHTPAGTEVAFGEDRGDTRGFAHAVVGAGADLVLGSGPHVVRGLELYRGRLIAYSLGNFLGYHTFSTGGTLSLSGILRVRLARSGRPLSGRWISVVLEGPGLPQLDDSRQSASLVRSLSADDFGPRAYPMTARGVLRGTGQGGG
jgi:capsule synthesis protein PGA_cap